MDTGKEHPGAAVRSGE